MQRLIVHKIDTQRVEDEVDEAGDTRKFSQSPVPSPQSQSPRPKIQ